MVVKVVETTPQIASTYNAPSITIRTQKWKLECVMYFLLFECSGARAKSSLLCGLSRAYKILHKISLISSIINIK